MNRFPSFRLAAIAAICTLFASQTGSAALVTIDHDVTIDAAHSYPEPPFPEPPLTVNIVDGVAGPTSANLVSGGVIGGFVRVGDTSHLAMSGGQVQALVTISDHATFTMVGGSIEPLISYYATVTAPRLLRLTDYGTLFLRGGKIGFDVIRQEESSVIHIYGHSFIVDGDLPTGVNPGSRVRVQGRFAGNQPFNILIDRDPLTAQVFLHTVPEPASALIAAAMVSQFFCIESLRRRKARGM